MKLSNEEIEVSNKVYSDLNINQKINCKGNCRVMYTVNSPLLSGIRLRHSGAFLPHRLVRRNELK